MWSADALIRSLDFSGPQGHPRVSNKSELQTWPIKGDELGAQGGGLRVGAYKRAGRAASGTFGDISCITGVTIPCAH